MISCDTNILFPACNSDSPLHTKARTFLESLAERDDFCLCEQVLMELYCLLRNPAVSSSPLTSKAAVGVIRNLRSNPHWRIVDLVPGVGLMERVWTAADESAVAHRRIFDARLAVILRHHGVRQFASRNEKDFEGFGFQRVWNPLA